MIGISTTYFALQGFGIYDSVAEANKMGFGLAELGAAHDFEKNIPATLKRLRLDFPETSFTVHTMFPPLKRKVWFNPSEGLTKMNKKIVEGFFFAAHIVEAELVSFHPGFKHKVFCIAKENNSGNVASSENPFKGYPGCGKEMQEQKAFENAFKVFSLAQKLSKQVGIDFAIENNPRTHNNKLLFVSKQGFEAAFERFENCGLLLDLGHALFSSNLQELLSLHDKIKQMHLHVSMPSSQGNLEDNHMPISSLQQLEPLSCIKQLQNIPLVFEHGTNVSRQELLEEKKLVEKFLKKF